MPRNRKKCRNLARDEPLHMLKFLKIYSFLDFALKTFKNEGEIWRSGIGRWICFTHPHGLTPMQT